MTELKHILVGFLLAGLFAFAIINAGILIGINNNATQNIGDDPSLSEYKTQLQDNLTSSYNIANASETSFGSSPISLTQIVFVDALGGIWKTLKVIPITIWNLTVGMFIKYIAPETSNFQFYVVIGVLSAILIISVIFGVWKMISTGDGG